MAQGNKESHTHRRMGAYDKENAQAWSVIMDKVRTLRDRGETLHAIGKRLGVGRDTVSRWVSEERGGERTTFGAMIRYTKALRIPFEDLLSGSLSVEANKEPEWQSTIFDDELRNYLNGFIKIQRKQAESVAKKAAQDNHATQKRILDFLENKGPLWASDVPMIAVALNQQPEELIKTVTEMVEAARAEQPVQQTLAG